MNQIKGGIILNYVIIVLNTTLGLLYTPYMLRMLGQSEYGLYSLVSSIIAYLTLLDFGFGSAIIRYTAKLISEKKTKEQWELNGMFLCVYSVIGLIALVAGLALHSNIDWLFESKMTQSEIELAKTMISLLIVNLVLTFPLSIFGSIISAYQDFIFQRAINIVRLVLSTGVIVLLLFWGYRAIAMVVVQTTFNISVLIINCIYCFRKLHIHISFSNFNWKIFKEIGYYSFWIFLSQIIDRIYWGTCQFVLGATIGTIAVAVYSVAILLQQMYMTFSSSISNVLLPKLTMLANSVGNEKQISDLFIKAGRLQSTVMAFILSGFIIFGSDFIKTWAGVDYAQSYPITLIFFVSLFIPTIQTTGYAILQARNQMKFRSLVYLIISLFSLWLQCVLSRQYGVIGCAIAVGGALILGQGLVMNIYYNNTQHIAIGQFWREIMNTLIVPIIMTVAFLLIRGQLPLSNIFQIGTMIIVFSMIYIPICYKFSLNSYEKSLVKSIICRIPILKK